MRALLAALIFAPAIAWGALDNIGPTIVESSHVAVCDGEPWQCWPASFKPPTNTVPEPDSLLLLAVAGVAGVVFGRRKK